ncbi:endonuclease/exonuclease/phosphatase family protein [Actinocrinis puniceicyclus]|uniref:endonuclease/exonuclease/phosphatase family protein n=1 Tax=Actinocrinis puniceicyclus TaxID=977794 RepID=UPI001B8B7825|nr:endonuclease/exonuclease/phosphatase family protein [Actinocrinis puniceicyclus]
MEQGTPILPGQRSGEDGVDPSDSYGYEPTLPYGVEPPAPGPGPVVGEGRPWPSARRQIGTAVAVLGWAIAAFLIGHRFLPDSAGIASLLETWLPWLAVPTALLLIAALAARSLRALFATVAATAVWLGGYGPQLFPRGDPIPANLRVISEDVNASSVELAGVGQLGPNQHADVVALEHLTPALATSSASQNLNAAYGYHVTQYEFGVWSRYPIADARGVDLATSTTAAADDANDANPSLVAAVPHVVVGALRVTVTTPQGPLVFYVVHIPQPVLGDQGFAKVRDEAVTRLAKTVSADAAPRLAVVGDINVAQTDRRFSQLSSGLGLTSAQAAAGSGFGFTWPAEFPAVRLDDLLLRGGTPVRSVVLPALSGGKSHLPIEIDLHL